MKYNKYPDGTGYFKLIPTDFYKNKIYRINSYEDLWKLNQLVDAYNFRNHRPSITIPNLIDAQADRRFNEFESTGLKLVCKFLNKMDADFRIFHPHNPEVVEALIDTVEIIDNTEFINNVLDDIYPNREDDLSAIDTWSASSEFQKNTILMSSDAGGFKPLMKLCDKIGWGGETYSCSKSRKYINGETKLTQHINRTDFKGKDILIIDDLSVYGGTFKGLSKLLKTRNCGKLYLAVSHMTMQNLGEDPVTNYFDKIFTTNSKFGNYIIPARGHDTIYGKKPKNLKIINLF